MSREVVSYINIDSNNRTKKALMQTQKIYSLETNPLSFDGANLLVHLGKNEREKELDIVPGDKILIRGVEKQTYVARYDRINTNARISFVFETNSRCLTVNGLNGISGEATDIKTIKKMCQNAKVTFSGFKSDKTKYEYFNFNNFALSVKNTDIGQHFSLTENIKDITIPAADFVVDVRGDVVRDETKKPYKYEEIWLRYGPSSNVQETEFTTTLGAKLKKIEAPTLPCSLRTYVAYLQEYQNVVHKSLLGVVTDPFPSFVSFIIDDAKTIDVGGIGNISLNALNTTHKMFFAAPDIDSNKPVRGLGSSGVFYIDVGINFEEEVFSYNFAPQSGLLSVCVPISSVSDVLVTLEHYGGIPIEYIAPGIRGYAVVAKVVDHGAENCLAVPLNNNGLLFKSFGGEMVTVAKTVITDQGYENPNSYRINLGRAYTNVSSVNIVESLFPISRNVFNKTNNTLFWQNLNDTDNIRSVTLESKKYSAKALMHEITEKAKNILYIGDGKVESVTHGLLFDIDEEMNKTVIKSYSTIKFMTSPFKNIKSMEELNTSETDPYYVCLLYTSDAADE